MAEPTTDLRKHNLFDHNMFNLNEEDIKNKYVSDYLPKDIDYRVKVTRIQHEFLAASNVNGKEPAVCINLYVRLHKIWWETFTNCFIGWFGPIDKDMLRDVNESWLNVCLVTPNGQKDMSLQKFQELEIARKQCLMIELFVREAASNCIDLITYETSAKKALKLGVKARYFFTRNETIKKLMNECEDMSSKAEKIIGQTQKAVEKSIRIFKKYLYLGNLRVACVQLDTLQIRANKFYALTKTPPKNHTTMLFIKHLPKLKERLMGIKIFDGEIQKMSKEFTKHCKLKFGVSQSELQAKITTDARNEIDKETLGQKEMDKIFNTLDQYWKLAKQRIKK